MMLFSTGLIAFGLFWYVPADIIPLAGEGAMLAISKTIKKPFRRLDCLDVTMVVISLVTCLICLHSLGSVGIGTIAAAILVGMELRWITKKIAAHKETRFSVLRKKETAQSPLLVIMKQEVYTVSEETSIRDALHLITEKKISGVPVTDGSQNLIGFLYRWGISCASLRMWSRCLSMPPPCRSCRISRNAQRSSWQCR